MSADFFDDYFREAQEVFTALPSLSNILRDVSDLLYSAIQSEKKIFWMGNGGSASDAQHLAAELVGRFELNRAPIASIALNTDTSIITAIANDFGYDEIFSRQVLALGSEGDVCVGISTSGKSKNVIKGLQVAQSIGIKTVSLVGDNTEFLLDCSDFVISVPSNRTCHIQESHIAIGQALCGHLELRLETKPL